MDYKDVGKKIREMAKKNVIEFLSSMPECDHNGEGLRQADISRMCGLEWGTYENTTASQQQFWIAGLLRELEKENLVQRDIDTRKWRLK